VAANSLRERILVAVLDAVRAPLQALGASVHRSPTVAMTREQSPALVVFPETDAITERANDRVTRLLTIRLVALARGVPPAVPESEADRLLTAAHAALMKDGTLGDLALGIREQDGEFEVEEADDLVVALPARYAITYRTLAHDISIQG
jgi:hypothetical protein